MLVPTQPVHPHADRGPARRRRARRADRARRAHRRAQRDAAHERHRPADRAFLTGERTAGGLLPRPRRASRRRSRAGSPTRRTPTCSGSRPRRRTSARRASSPPRSTSGSRASCSPTTARRRSTGSATSTTTRSRVPARRSAELGYRFQFITLAGFHSLNLGDVRARPRLRCRGHDRLRAAAGARVRDGGARATPRRRHQREVGAGYFDLVAEAVSGGERRRSRSRARPRRRSSRTPSRDVTRRRRSRFCAPADDDVLTREALEFVARLHRELEPARRELLGAAPRAAGRARRGALRPAFLPGRPGRSARAAGGWRRRRPTSATAAARSPARPTAR